MEYGPYTLLLDVGWISFLMMVGNFLRNRVRIFQQLLLPAPITAGIIGLVLGPSALGVIGFSDKIGSYTTLLIALVFASMAYSMDLGGSVSQGARNMWSYSTGIFLGQWALFSLLGVYVFAPLFGTEPWFGMMLPVGFVGGFGTAAAVGGALEAGGAEGAASLGFASATVGTLVAIIGGVIVANWGIRTGRSTQLSGELPKELRSGYIATLADRPSIGRATTNPSAIEPLALHGGFIVFTVLVAYLINGKIADWWDLSVPLFAMSFIIGLLGRLFLKVTGHREYLDRDTVSTISGAATDYLIAFGIASIVPAAIASYWVPLLILFVAGTVYCLLFLFFMSPIYFGQKWLERGIFSWGWATAALATGIALLKMVDPNLRSGTLDEYGVAYVGFAPFEIGITIIAPIVAVAGATALFGWGAFVVALVVLGSAVVLGWIPGKQKAKA